MFKRIKKKTNGEKPVHSKWMEAFRRYQRRLCDRLKERTRHWSRQRKIAMLTIIIIFFGGIYTAILIKTIQHEGTKRMYFIREPDEPMDSAIKQFKEMFAPKNKDEESKP